VFKHFMHVGISVGDMERSVAFYRDVLGFEVVGTGEAFDEEDKPLDLQGVHLLSTAMRCGDCQIELLQFLSPQGRTEAPNMSDAGCVHMALAVDDIHSVYEKLLDAGAQVLRRMKADSSGPTGCSSRIRMGP